MENPEISESTETILCFLPSEFSDEYDHYDENLDDYDLNEDDTYDDGIAKSVQDDGWEENEEDDGEEYLPETGPSDYDEDFEDFDELDD